MMGRGSAEGKWGAHIPNSSKRKQQRLKLTPSAGLLPTYTELAVLNLCLLFVDTRNIKSKNTFDIEKYILFTKTREGSLQLHIRYI